MPPFERISEQAIAELVRRFYAKVRRDPEIGPVFNAAIEDWDEHLVKLAAFWSSIMLTTGRYKGNPMAAHLRQPIEPPMFQRWLALWAETTGELFVPELAERFQQKAARIGDSLQLGLFYRPDRVRAGTCPVAPR